MSGFVHKNPAILRLYELVRDHRPNDTVAYVTRTVRNMAIDIVRRRRRQEPAEQEFLVNADGTSCGISPRVLADAFRTLQPAERETIVLHVYAGMSFQETADSRGRSVTTIAAWYRRGLVKLRTFLEVEHE